MNFESIAEKIIPWTIMGLVGAMFTMYMDVAKLKDTAMDYKQRADKAHECYEKETRNNREELIRLKTKVMK